MTNMLATVGMNVFTPSVIGAMLIVSSVAGYVIFNVSRKKGKRRDSDKNKNEEER